MTNVDMIAAIKAFDENGVVQERYTGSNKFQWYTTKKPSWNFTAYEYRPVPKPREWWIRCGYVFNSKEAALCDGEECVHVREVLEDE